MKRVEITGQTRTSTIFVGELLENASAYFPTDTRVVVITDETVDGLYGGNMPATDRIVIGTGEKVKTLETVSHIYRRLIEMEADRSVFLLGIGGGIVCDITGFVAATYLRGVRFANVATTLLAQVDASVGGKTGVNFDGYKNMVGVFNQPSFVICDPYVLKTLPRHEVASGFAEIVKHAAIVDEPYFALLEGHVADALALKPDFIERVVYESVVIKADIVNRDERERGERRKLNFGHTMGHAIEKATGVAHGEAVSAGMVAAAHLSAAKGVCAAKDVSRLERLLFDLGLPTSIPCNAASLFDALARDKKRQEDHIHFVLLKKIGSSLVAPVALSELRQVLFENPEAISR